jgi:hypothetical protein
MTTSPPERSRPWGMGDQDLEFDLLAHDVRGEDNLATEAPQPLDPSAQSEIVEDADNDADLDEPGTGQAPGWSTTDYDEPGTGQAPGWTATDHDEPGTGQAPGWTATVYTQSTGIPGRGVVIVATLATVLCVGLDLVVTRGVTYFFDLCFVVICLVSSMAIRRRDLFTAGVLPPLVFGLVVAAVTVRSPAAFVAGAGWTEVFLTGLAAHAGALVAGYAVALATVGARLTANRGSPT